MYRGFQESQDFRNRGRRALSKKEMGICECVVLHYMRKLELQLFLEIFRGFGTGLDRNLKIGGGDKINRVKI